MEAAGYDYAPVLEDGHAIGLVSTKEARRLGQNAEPLTANHLDACNARVGVSVALPELCDALSEHEAALVMENLNI